MQTQLRIYSIAPGAMAAWVDEWRRLVAPLREQYGFRVRDAWVGADGETFVWVLERPDEGLWEAADRAYFDSTERRSLDPDTARHVAAQQTLFVRPARA